SVAKPAMSLSNSSFPPGRSIGRALQLSPPTTTPDRPRGSAEVDDPLDLRRGHRHRPLPADRLEDPRALFGLARLRHAVDCDQAEVRGPALGPLEVVDERPMEVAAHVHTAG